MTATRRGATKLEKAEDYDLKRSKDTIGALYPVLTDPKGRIIDGMHRLSADKTWPKHVVGNINDEKDFLMARLIANLQRKGAGAEDKTKMLKELADETKWNAEEIAEHTGMSTNWVRKYLDQKHKNAKMSELASRKHELTKAEKEPEESEHTCQQCGSCTELFYCCLDCGEMEEAVGREESCLES